MADQGLGAGAAAAPTGARGWPRAPIHLFGLLAVFLALAITFGGMGPPPAASASAPIDAFSAERAMVHVRELAKKPRPVGSVGHDLARDYLLAKLRELGLEPEVQKTFTTQKFFGRVSGAVLENIIARVAGRSGDRRALLFAAHYDAVPQSPGAGDDGSGTAALLETARAVVQGPPLDRDVIFFFTDAEELGLLGASAFVTEHPAAKDVIGAFNFDARGSHGGVAMFDTSDQSGGLIRALAKLPHMQASSFVSALAKVLPNDTDATMFKKAGIPTMSFAFADGVINYHRASDSPDNLDPRSVQQMGDSALALARNLGRGALPSLEEDDLVYFTFFGRVLLRASYPATILTAIAAFLAILAAGFAAAKRRREEVRGKNVLLAALFSLLLFLLAVVVGIVITWALNRSVSLDALLVRSGAISISAFAATLLASISSMRLVARRLGLRAAALGGYLALGFLALVIAIFATAASVPFVGTSVCVVIAAWMAALARDGAPARTMTAYFALAGTALFWVPTLYSLTVAAAAGAAIPIAVLSVPAALLVAPLCASLPMRPMIAFAGAAIAAMAFSFVRLAWPLGDLVPDRSTLAYGVDGDRKQGFYFGSQPRPWMAAALPAEGAGKRMVTELTLTETEFWTSPPEVTGLTGVTVERAERRRLAEGFEIRAVLRPEREARCIALWDETRRITDVASVNGKAVRQLVRFSPQKDAAIMDRLRVGGMKPATYFQFCGMAGEPVEVVLQTREEAEVPVRIVEIRDGIPPAKGGVALERPKGEIPTDDSDRTVVGKTVRL